MYNPELSTIQNDYRDKPIGKKFEYEVIRTMQSRMKKLAQETKNEHYENIIEPTLNNDMDQKEGTDLIYDDELRVDITLNFSNKSYMPYIYESDIMLDRYNDIKLKYGIRHGNTHRPKGSNENYTEFKELVVVIGADIDPDLYKRNDDVILDQFGKYTEKIFETALNIYYECEDAKEQESSTHLLKKNPSYERYPKTIGPEYKKMLDYLHEHANDEHENQDNTFQKEE